jgi:hypothetical protein
MHCAIMRNCALAIALASCALLRIVHVRINTVNFSVSKIPGGHTLVRKYFQRVPCGACAKKGRVDVTNVKYSGNRNRPPRVCMTFIHLNFSAGAAAPGAVGNSKFSSRRPSFGRCLTPLSLPSSLLALWLLAVPPPALPHHSMSSILVL